MQNCLPGIVLYVECLCVRSVSVCVLHPRCYLKSSCRLCPILLSGHVKDAEDAA